MEAYMSALVKATKTRLTATTEIWGNRVLRAAPMVSEDKPAVYPYVVCTLVGGGREPQTKAAWVAVLWQIRAVAKDATTAYQAQARISELMADADYGTAKALDGGDDWIITTTSERRMIEVVEHVLSNILYHAGSEFYVVMQAK